MYFPFIHGKISPKGRDSVDEKTTLASEMAATNLYHIHQWSQFETIVVDSGEGDGNANYVQGDNTGGIFNGQGYRETEEEGQAQGSASQGN